MLISGPFVAPRRFVTVLAGALLMVCISAVGTTSAAEETAAGAGSGKLILVTGATGTQGGAVARELLGRGYAVRGLTRSPDKPRAAALAKLGAEMVAGSYDDPDSLNSAMAGVHGVFAVTAWWEHGVATEIIHGRALVDAAKAAGVQHFVYTSVAGADEKTGVPHFDSKHEIEQYLAKSGLNWSVVRPVSFMDNWPGRREEFLSGRFVDPGEPDQSHQWIAAVDIAFFVAEAFDNPGAWNARALDIAGDEMTLAEFASLLAAVLDRPVRQERISWADYEAANGKELTIMHRWFDTDGYAVDVAGLLARYPQLTSAETFLRGMNWGPDAAEARTQ